MDETSTSKVSGQVKSVLQKIPKSVKRALIAIVIIAALAVGAVAIINALQGYTVLFTGLSTDDMTNILTYLDSEGVSNYKVQNNDTILVPSGQEATLKAQVLMQGYPKSGFAYSTYLDNINSLSTESDRETMYLFDLQDRLGAVIKCFDGVKDATVTIAQAENNSYVLNRDDEVEASAAVLVTMQGTKTLTDQQATAIRNLVGSAVQGLVIENVTITDTLGNTYSAGTGDTTTSSGASQLKLELEEQVNQKIRTNILQVLIPLFGAENLSVSVNSTVDVSTTTIDSVDYTEPDWAADGSTNGEGIIGSKVYDVTYSDDGVTASGAVGTDTNSDIPTYVDDETASTGNAVVDSSGEIDYDVDTTRTQTERPAGVVTDVMIAVSINDDGTNFDRNSLITHIARAAGISEEDQDDKISILASKFYETETDTSGIISDDSFLPEWAFYALIAGVGLFLILLLVILLLRKKKRKSRKPIVEAAPIVTAAAEQQSSPDIMDIQTDHGVEIRDNVREFATQNPEIAAQMIKNWLRGGDEK